MEDLLFVLGTVGFFGLAAAYVRLCDRIIGPDPVDATVGASASEPRAPMEVGA